MQVPREARDEGIEESRLEIALPRLRLAQLDGVLRLEVAARKVLGAGKGHEGRLPLLEERVDGSLERGVKRPVGIDRQGARAFASGARNGDVRPRLVVEAVGNGNQDV